MTIRGERISKFGVALQRSLVVAVFLVLLVAGYIGAYYANVEQKFYIQ